VGTAKSLSDYIPTSYNIAGKTGTSDDSRDSWFAGFSDDKLAVVWIGRDDNTPINLSGSKGALQVWGNMMSQLHIRPLRLSEPPDIKWVRVPLYKQKHDDPKIGEMISLPFIRDSAYIANDEVSNGQKKVQSEVESKNIIEKFFDWLF
jgi:penicillin-binding protein 1B